MSNIDENDPRRELVVSVLTNLLSNLWYEKYPHHGIDRYTFEFQNFCERVLYSALNQSAK